MSGCRVRFAAIAAAGLGVVSFAPGAHANIKICQGIEQSYEQIARGASNKEIARTLDIAETTVKIHVQHILRKLGLSSRVQAAVYASDRQR